MLLSELLSQNPTAKQYFSSLPLYVQETMMQIGQDFTTEEELRQRAQLLMENSAKNEGQ